MKKKLLLAFTAIFIISCSDDDSVNMGHLTGRKWYISSYESGLGVRSYHHECSTSKDYIEFSTETDTFTDISYAKDCSIYSQESGTYSVKGTTITRTGETVRSEVKELSSNKLVTEDFLDGDGNGSVDYHLKITYAAN